MVLMYHALSNLRLPVFGALEAVGVALVVGHCSVDAFCAGLDEGTVLDDLMDVLVCVIIQRSVERLTGWFKGMPATKMNLLSLSADSGTLATILSPSCSKTALWYCGIVRDDDPEERLMLLLRV